jgi:hypothetical protein
MQKEHVLAIAQITPSDITLEQSRTAQKGVLLGWPEPYIYGVCTVFLAGKSSSVRSYMM